MMDCLYEIIDGRLAVSVMENFAWFTEYRLWDARISVGFGVFD